jgi:DNA-binding NtrC family response regulator
MYILIVDDDEKSRGVLAKLLKTLGHQVTECLDGYAAIEAVKLHEFHLIISDIRMPRISGIELLKKIRALPANQDIAVILFTGFGDMQTAIEALRLGAFDYLLKPINFKELVVLIERVAEHLALKRDNRVLTNKFEAAVKAATAETVQELSQLKALYAKNIIQSPDIYFSEQMAALIEQVRILHQDRSLPVLIEGETGTGKEVIARLVHFGEGCATAPFVDLNCAAIPPSVFESELFGYEAGAFTGCLPSGQKGKLDLAFDGTLFLDEITEMPLELQAKLLRILQEKEFYRVGGLKKIKTNVRVICATNTDIEDKMAQGAFRRDLFFRLNAARIQLPPLRQRKDEIIPLAESFLARFTKEKGKRFEGINKEAGKFLNSYDWPGNIRELKNVIEYAVVMYNDNQLKKEHLDPLLKHKIGINAIAQSDSALLPPASLSLAKHTDRIILQALRMHDGNKTDTARYLGMPIRTLYRRLQRLSEL